jgi:hypothetical protein
MNETLSRHFNPYTTNTIAESLRASAIILAMTALFILPALYNRFPFVFPDTGGYLGAWGMRNTVQNVYYAVFNRITDLRISPWPTVVVQSAMTAWVIWRFASTVFSIKGMFRLILLSVFLTMCTSLPWFVSWLMPDIFTSLMIIALTLLCFLQDRVPRSSKIILVLLISTAVAVHQSHLPVALWTLPGLGLCVLLGWRPSKAFLHGFFAIGLGLALGIAALATANLLSGRLGLSRGGSVFLLARMLEDGTALSYLKQVCPQQRFGVCTYLDELESYNSLHPNSLSGHFLFGGPLEKLGGVVAEEQEATTIVVSTLLKYPLVQLRASMDDAWHQLLLFATGAEFSNYPGVSSNYPGDRDISSSEGVRVVFGAAVYDSYSHSKQVRGILTFDFINHIHLAILIISLIILIGFLAVARTRQTFRSFYPAIFVTVLVIGNAFTLGVLSGPYPRYQARVIWLIPLLAGCFLLAPRNVETAPLERHPAKPGATRRAKKLVARGPRSARPAMISSAVIRSHHGSSQHVSSSSIGAARMTG